MKKIFSAVIISVSLFSAQSVYAATNDQIHYWKMDEGMGRSVNDSVGGQNGVMTGSSTGFGWASGKVGTAIGMDGAAGTGIVLPNAFLTGSQGSIALWLNVQQLSDQNIIFAGKAVEDSNIYVAFSIDRDGRPQLQFRDSAAGSDRRAQATRILNRNEWYNLVITANSIGYRVYVNGEEATMAGENIGRWFPDFTNRTLSYRIGTSEATPMNGSFNGYLDDLRIYNRALTKEDAALLFTEGNDALTTVPAGVAPNVVLSISEDRIPFGGSVSVNWKAGNVDLCTASGSWNGTIATSGQKVFIKLSDDVSYTLSCSNKYGTAESTVKAKVGTTTSTANMGSGTLTVAPVMPGNSGNTPAAIMAVSFVKNLAMGARGDEVKALQAFLVGRGYLAGNLPMGYFGGLTKAAVARFQKANGLPPTGFVGPMTRAVLNK